MAELRALTRGAVLGALALTVIASSAMFTVFTYIAPILQEATQASSAFVTAILFVLPLLRRLAGASPEACLPRAIPAVLAAPSPRGGSRREFLRARWSDEGIEPLAERDSSALRALAAADALIDRPANCEAGAPGNVVRVIPLQP